MDRGQLFTTVGLVKRTISWGWMNSRWMSIRGYQSHSTGVDGFWKYVAKATSFPTGSRVRLRVNIILEAFDHTVNQNQEPSLFHKISYCDFKTATHLWHSLFFPRVNQILNTTVIRCVVSASERFLLYLRIPVFWYICRLQTAKGLHPT